MVQSCFLSTAGQNHTYYNIVLIVTLILQIIHHNSLYVQNRAEFIGRNGEVAEHSYQK